jgi:GTP:adenosylcobinamide-phosphate guanylyltransferase
MEGNGWSALVLAGQRPGKDTMAEHFAALAKALIDFAGKPMLTRVVETLNATPGVVRVAVIAQATGLLEDAVADGGGAALLTSGSGISSSIAAVAGTAALPFPILVTTADHPLLTPEIVAGFLAQVSDADIAVGMVGRDVMLARYPENQRTWLKFADGHWSGANLFALRTEKCLAALDLWSRAEQDRKTAWKLFLHFGPWLAIRALTRTIGLGDALTLAGKRLALKAKLVPLAQAEAAIDVDKPSDHREALAIWHARASDNQPKVEKMPGV